MRDIDLVSAWEKHPNYCINIETIEYRLQLKFRDVIIADSENVLILNEPGIKPNYYFPREDINHNYFSLTNKVTFCPFKGLASHWTLSTEDESTKILAWSYDDPFKKLKIIQNYVAFDLGESFASVVH